MNKVNQQLNVLFLVNYLQHREPIIGNKINLKTSCKSLNPGHPDSDSYTINNCLTAALMIFSLSV